MNSDSDAQVPTRWIHALSAVSVAFALYGVDCRNPNSPSPSPASPSSHPGPDTIYDAGLKPGWQDWGWGAHELSQGGPARIDFSHFGGWNLHHEAPPARFGGLSFRMLAPSTFGEFLQVQLGKGENDRSLPSVDVSADRIRELPTGWAEVFIPWTDLNPRGLPFDRVTIRARSEVGSEWVQLDKIAFTPSDPNGPTGKSPALQATAPKSVTPKTASSRQVALRVDCRSPGHPISPYIYGIAGKSVGTGATARRWGGNPNTRYNWQLNAYNTGKDWYFENVKSDDYREFLADNLSASMASALTVPIIGWVAKDTQSVGFPKSIFGQQRAHDPHRPEAGDGVAASGGELKPQAATLTSIPAPPEMIQKWVETIALRDQKTHSRSVHMYILDNEPTLWNSTHRDVHPEPLTYDELLDRTIRYGSAVRKADPQALIAGPAEWGWMGYFYSARDAAAGVSARPDRRAHGDLPLIPWYLKKLQEHERAHGTRVLDVLDVHYYPQGDGIYAANADAPTAAMRLRSTRGLWDPTYKDESWIAEPIKLLPRLKQWIKEYYPGLKLSLGEYNFGAEQHISGGLAQAEALGRFGTEGLDYAFYWFDPPLDSPVYFAFRAFRNFDGKGGKFLNRSLDTRMDASVSLFASRDDSGKHLVLILLNLEAESAAQAAITLEGCGRVATRRKFSYKEGSRSLIEEGSEESAARRGDPHELKEELAPYSINVLDVVLE